MAQSVNRAVLFVNGDLPEPERFQTMLRQDDILIAVDGGLRHMTTLDLMPSLIIGDMDSADPDEVARLESQGVEVRRFPTHKDETDLELALDAALKMNVDIIWIVAALGDRIDQTLGNVFLLTAPQIKSLDVRLVDGLREVFLIRDKVTISGKSGQTVSLIPLLGTVEGVQTHDLAYPLKEETLFPYKTRGISNVMQSETAVVSIKNGCLLCIHTFTESTKTKGQ